MHFYLTDNILSSWSDYTSCDAHCTRGKQKRYRSCLDPNQYDAVKRTCGNHPLQEEIECLSRDGCKGTGYYLAQVNMSCTDFCKTKGMWYKNK